MATAVTFKVLRSHAVPHGAGLRFFYNGALNAQGFGGSNGGAIDWASPISSQPIKIWPRGKVGFGLGFFGEGHFGQTGDIAGPNKGFGYGTFGTGEFGTYTDYLEWSTRRVGLEFTDGNYVFGVALVDSVGNQSAGVNLLQAIISAPEPPRRPEITAMTQTTISFAVGRPREFKAQD